MTETIAPQGSGGEMKGNHGLQRQIAAGCRKSATVDKDYVRKCFVFKSIAWACQGAE